MLVRDEQDGARELWINFGLFAGREVTAMEVEQLGRSLLGVLDRVTIVVENRYELDARSEVTAHGVRVELPPEWPPDGRLVAITEEWARSCVPARAAG